MDKRAIIMTIFIPMMTAFICGVAVTLYVYQNGQLENSLVSPQPVLEIQDQIQIYEMWENQALNGASSLSDFCQKFAALGDIRNVIYSGSSPENFCKGIYSVSGNKVVRAPIKKSILLKAKRTVTNFAVDFEYTFGKTIILDRELAQGNLGSQTAQPAQTETQQCNPIYVDSNGFFVSEEGISDIQLQGNNIVLNVPFLSSYNPLTSDFWGIDQRIAEILSDGSISSSSVLSLDGMKVVTIAQMEKATVVSFKGVVQYQKAGESAWQSVGKEMVLGAEDIIRTGFGSEVVLQFADKSLVTIGAGTKETIKNIYEKKSTIKNLINIKYGLLEPDVDSSNRPDRFQCTDPVQTLSIRG